MVLKSCYMIFIIYGGGLSAVRLSMLYIRSLSRSFLVVRSYEHSAPWSRSRNTSQQRRGSGSGSLGSLQRLQRLRLAPPPSRTSASSRRSLRIWLLPSLRNNPRKSTIRKLMVKYKNIGNLILHYKANFGAGGLGKWSLTNSKNVIKYV